MRVTLCVVPTAVTAAAKDALEAPDGTTTVAGTTTLVLLLARLTVKPVLGAAALSATVHASLVNPLTDAAEQENELKAAVAVVPPVPERLTATEFPAEELVETVRVPVALPATVGSN